ncbi:MAG TPA: hypothetical protein VMT08_24825 [Bradyrhizobium sp.]|nr:hypothetical protein [Bradyrhizobium sp.]
MREIILGLCVAASIPIGPNTIAGAAECVSCDTIIELQGGPPVVLAFFFKFRPPPPRAYHYTPPSSHYAPPPTSRYVPPPSPREIEGLLNRKPDGVLRTEPLQPDGTVKLPQQLIEQLQKDAKPIDPIVSALEAQVARNEAWQNAAKESSTFVVERLDSQLGEEPTFILFTGRGDPMKFKANELFKLAETARTEWESVPGRSKRGLEYTFEGRLTPQELDSAALTIAVGSGGRARMVAAPKQLEELSSFRKVDPVSLSAVKIQVSGSRYTAVQSFSSGTIKITAASRELLVRMLEAVRQLLVEFGLMSPNGVMLAKTISPAQKKLLIARIKREAETSLAQLSADDALTQQAKKGKAVGEGRATVQVQFGDEVTRWNFTDRADQARRFAHLSHE